MECLLAGVVRTHVTLDHEACAHYWITVVARDLSPVPLEAFADLHVAVRNLNDQVPLTEHPAYAVTVAEHTTPGAVILTLAAQDKDSPVVDWRLVDDAAGRFAIDRRLGTITSVGPLDREAHERHVLEVVLADEGEPSLSSTTQVLVTLTDINDHKPTFTQSLYRFRVLPSNGQVEAVPLCQVGVPLCLIASNCGLGFFKSITKGPCSKIFSSFLCLLTLHCGWWLPSCRTAPHLLCGSVGRLVIHTLL